MTKYRITISGSVSFLCLFLMLALSPGVIGGPTNLDQPSTNAPVVITDSGGTVTLENGIVSAKINKANGNLLSLQYRGVEMLSHGGGYWNIYGCIPGQPYTEKKGTPSVF